MFILRTTEMPTLAKLTELERIVAVDQAGLNAPVGAGPGKACLVGEFLQGPFSPTIMTTPGDVKAYYLSGVPSRFTLLSQSAVNPASAVQDGSGVTLDGNGWAELKGKTINGLVIQRVDCDMVAADSSSTKVYVKFDVVVDTSDGTSTTNKDIIIPSGTRFADQAIGTATKIIATSQQIRIPAGTAIAGGAITCGISFLQQPDGSLLYSTTGTRMGVTAFFVKGTKATSVGTDLIDTAVDTVIPGYLSTIGGTVSTIVLAGTGGDAYAAAGGGAAPSPDTLSNRIAACYPAAINKTMPGTNATQNIVAIWSARNYQTTVSDGAKTMRANLWTNAKEASKIGRGRVACVTTAPATGVTASDATTAKALYTGLRSADSIASSDADADRYWPSGPFRMVWSDELNANIMVSSCGFRAAMKVNLLNDGKSEYPTSVGPTENVGIQNTTAAEDCFEANPLAEADFVAMRAAGIAWLVRDNAAGVWFYSGVTIVNQVNFANRVDDFRRSFADEVQDVIFGLATKYSKKPGTPQRSEAFRGDMIAYLEQLKTPGIGDSRCKDYQVLDGAAAGNTDTLNGHGVFLFEADVQMYGIMGTIVVKTMIGPTVVIAQVGG